MIFGKKARKKAQLKKNRFHQEIFNCLRLRRAEEDRSKKSAAKQAIRPADMPEEPVWSEKTAAIRNRLTGKKRESKERWNRFAGTSGGGARGL